MRKNSFLTKLKKEEKLELVEPSEDVCESYLDKADDCVASAKLLLINSFYENSVGMSYYAMYDSLVALLFRTGIKCENHSASILLLKLLFGKMDLFTPISEAKEERIDKQYYVTTEKNELTKEIAEELSINAEGFVVKMKLFIKDLGNEEIDDYRKKLQELKAS